jgi:hypothetical protein
MRGVRNDSCDDTSLFRTSQKGGGAIGLKSPDNAPDDLCESLRAHKHD